MTDQEARDCEHEYEAVSYSRNLYRCPKGCDYFVRSLGTLEEVRATEQRRRERRATGELVERAGNRPLAPFLRAGAVGQAARAALPKRPPGKGPG